MDFSSGRAIAGMHGFCIRISTGSGESTLGRIGIGGIELFFTAVVSQSTCQLGCTRVESWQSEER